MSSKFTWNHIVRAVPTAPRSARPGERAWVVGMTDQHGEAEGAAGRSGYMYTIEFEDGSDCQIHENDIELIPDMNDHMRPDVEGA